MDAERKRREQATMHVLERFQTTEWVEHVRFIRRFASGAEDVGNLVATSQDEQEAMLIVEQREAWGIFVADGIIDIDLVDKMIGNWVVVAWGVIGTRIAIARQENDDDRIAEYFQWLAETIGAREAKSKRPPAYVALRGRLV